ncbi:hypothetical protein LZ32DRAFT_599670 [Colletotrichum eremochloae]|nr:hypothetical protein LZ32DRAFT_599670 [Colletotrichum eremochloae]
MASNLGALNGVKPACQHRPSDLLTMHQDPFGTSGAGGGKWGSLGGPGEEGRGAVSAGKSVATGPRCSRHAKLSVPAAAKRRFSANAQRSPGGYGVV